MLTRAFLKVANHRVPRALIYNSAWDGLAEQCRFLLMLGAHLQLVGTLIALFCAPVIRSSSTVAENVPIIFIPGSKTAASTPLPDSYVPIEQTADDNRFLAVDLVARAHGKAISDHFDSPLARHRVNFDERQKMLSKVLGVRALVSPFQKGASPSNHVRRIRIIRAFVVLPSFKPIIYLDEHDNKQYKTYLFPFFFSIAPAYYDAQEASGIPVNQVEVVRLASLPPWLEVSTNLLRTARAMREQIIRSCFLPIVHRPPAAFKSETIRYRLRLPTDAPFHPSTFSHPLLDLGDVVKIIVIYCTRQNASFLRFRHRIMPFADILRLESDPIENGRHTYRKPDEYLSGGDENTADCFIQTLFSQPFRLLKPPAPLACLQGFNALASKDAPWPPLCILETTIPMIILARHHDFVSNPNEQPVIGHAMCFTGLEFVGEKAIAESMRAAKEVWIDVDIPASTSDSLKMLASVVALRRLSAKFNYKGSASK